MSCLFAATFTMKADVLRQTDAAPDGVGDAGSWVGAQDPVWGETVRQWTSDSDADTPGTQVETISCDVRPITSNTRGFGGNVEAFGAAYSDSDYAQMKFPADIVLSKRARVTNVRNRDGSVLWKEEEMSKVDDSFRATIFDVIGVYPVLGPFGEHLANTALLQRAGIQA